MVVTTGAISRTKLQSNHHHQQTNIFFSYRPDAFLSPNQQCQSTEGKSTEGTAVCGLETLLLFFPAEIIHHTCILVAKRDVNMIHPLILTSALI